MKTLIEVIAQELIIPSKGDSEYLENYYYNKCSVEQKQAIDNTLLSICGYEMSTLLSMRKEAKT